MLHPRVLDRERSLLVVIDVQEGYRGKTVEHERMVRSVRRLIEAAKALQIPILATEQYPEGLGHTQVEIAEGFPPDQVIVGKLSMSCCGQSQFVSALETAGRSQVLLCGIEAHACVNQTAHDLLQRGYQVHVAWDATSSRFEHDYRIAWEKMTGSGVVPASVEMACLEWVKKAGTAEFKAVHRLIK